MARYIDADKLVAWCNETFQAQSTVTGKAYVNAFLTAALSCTTADVVPKSEEGAECPTCHGTGRIGTTDWLTKNISKKQLAEEKAQAIAEHEQHIKTEVAREIFEEIDKIIFPSRLPLCKVDYLQFLDLKTKYTEGGDQA